MMEIIDRLCPACRRLFSDRRIKLRGVLSSDRNKHHDPPSLLQKASEAGCYVCTRVWKRLSSEEKALVLSTHWWTKWFSLQSWLLGYGADLGSYNCEQSVKGDEMNFIFGPGMGDWKEVTFKLYGTAEQIELSGLQNTDHSPPVHVSLQDYISSVHLESSTESDQTWNTIMNWWNMSLRKCSDKSTGDRNHQDSPGQGGGPPLKHPFYPTRLLDLKPPCTSLSTDPCLSIAEIDERDGPYMTLSYRWRRENEPPANSPESWELTSQTLEEMQSQITFVDLPKAYQDAIIVTRRLGIRYLWIDALCIVQDDILDWSQEAGRMGQIYQEAICNISAGIGTVKDGLFGTRIPKDVMPLEIDAAWTIQNRDEKEHRDRGTYYLIEKHYLEQHLSQASLYTRGWVVQERCLSPRILHFSSEQVFWQQYQHNYCELFPMGCPGTIKGYKDTIRPAPRSTPYSTPLATWDQVIEQYSATSLTRPADKMVAIAGLAQHWSVNMPRDEYYAGLWKSTFPTCLLWKVADGRDHKNRLSFRSTKFLAPSWSWLSVNGKVKANKLHHFDAPGWSVFRFAGQRNIRAEILEFNLRPKITGFKLGPLEQGAYVVIRCRLKSAIGMYWPMTSLRAIEIESDWSIIHACTSPRSSKIECSIDDMTRFLKRWNNSVPSQKDRDGSLRHAINTMAPYALFLGMILSSILHHTKLQLLGALLTTASNILWWPVWHFTNFGSSGLYFAEICTTQSTQTEGLVVQRLNDGTYCRLGMFTAQDVKLFADAPECDISLV